MRDHAVMFQGLILGNIAARSMILHRKRFFFYERNSPSLLNVFPLPIKTFVGTPVSIHL